MNGATKRIVNLLLIILGLFVLFAVYLRWREPSLIYYPARDLDDTPDRHGWPSENVWLTTADGVRIHGWFIPADGGRSEGVRSGGRPPPAEGSGPTTRPTILFLHGNAGNISHRFDKLAILRDLGADVLIIDYRGYGRSDGAPNEAGTYADAAAAYAWLATPETRLLDGASSAKAGNLKPETLILYGESLGSAIAVELATRVPVGGVILEEPFTSIADVGQRMFPFIPIRWIVRNRYDTLGKIARINAPLLIFHSRQDEYFSIRHAERLLAAATEPKQLIELQGSHNDAFLVSGDRYRRGLREFLVTPPS